MNKLNEIISNSINLDVQAGLTEAKNEIIKQAKFGVNDIIIPIVLVILAGILVLQIAKAVDKHKHNDNYSDQIKAIIVIVLVIAVVASARLWIWTMVGV